jgi:DNA-directed RNA polymerase subunit beta'
MRTFHQGGVAGIDITMGLPRVEEIFERRAPKNPAIVATVAGEIIEIREEGKEKIIKLLADPASVKKGKSNEIEFVLPFRRSPLVKVGDNVKKGDLLSDGSADLSELFKYAGKEATEEYIIKEINNVYELQGASISRKHIEVIIRQMFSRRKIVTAGDTTFSNGDIVENMLLERENTRAREEGGEEAKGTQLILGISEVSLTTKSWLSAASFQNTTRVLIATAVKGGADDLRGLKENVIIGRLIPAGTGFNRGSESEDEAEDVDE